MSLTYLPVAAIVFVGFTCGKHECLVGRAKAISPPARRAWQITIPTGLLGAINNIIEV